MEPCAAGLIWNKTTRGDLHEALEREEAALLTRQQRAAQGVAPHPAWNFAEFSVHYRSLEHHLCVAGVYVRCGHFAALHR